jgi:gliding motility-associated-like protein
MKKSLLLIFSVLFMLKAWSQTPVPMASQPGNTYTETFTDIANWTNGFGSGTGASAFKSVLANNTGTIPNGTTVTTSSATFSTGTSGGVQKGTQNLLLLSTGATDNTTSVAVDFFVNFSGVNAGNLSFNWATVFNSTGNRNGSLRVYTSTDGTTFTELTTAQALNFTNNVAGSGTVNVALPSSLNNIATAIIRFYYHNGAGGTTGSRPKVSIDDLTVTATTGATPTPSIAATPNALDFGTQLTGSSSAEKSFSLNTANLNGTSVNLTTTAPYSISKTSGGSFSTSLTYTNTELTGSNTVYTKFAPSSSGVANANISITGGGASSPASVSLTGIGQSSTVSVSETALDFGNQTTGTNSVAKTYTLSGTNLSNNVTVSTNAPFTVSKDGITYSASITYTPAELATSKTVSVRFSPTALTTSTENILNVNVDASTQSITVTGTGIAPILAPAHVVISEVYGGGGNSGATFKNDFIELYNPSNTSVDLTGWSVQYASATGTTWQTTPLSGSIPARGYFLIQEAAGAGGTVNLPTPDVTGTIAMSGTTFKVILSNSTTALTGANPTGSTVIDKIGVGPTANGFEGAAFTVITNTTSAERKAFSTSNAATMAVGGADEFNGNAFDSDANNTDFVISTPTPQNSTDVEPKAANHIVISEIYGGGGNSGATYKNDFIELYNPTNADVNLSGWSVQYGAAGNTNWSTTALTGIIKAKGFYLIQEAAGAGGTLNLPTPDATGSLNLSGTTGKVLLSNATAAQTGANPSGPSVIDLVGFGTANGFEGTAPAPATSNTTSIERKANAGSTATTMAIGGTDEFAGNGYDQDQNSTDFIVRSPNPQNSTVTEPASTSGPFLTLSPNALAFSNQAVGTVSTTKSYILSGGNLTNNTTLTTSAPYSISKDNVTFATSLSYTVADLATNQTVYVKFSPTVTGNATAAILHASAGANAQSLALTGVAIDPNQTVFNFESCTTVGSSALSDGFYQYSVKGAQTWGCTTTFGHDASDVTGAGSLGNALQINGYSGGNIENEDWLISPALNISSFTYPILSYWTRSAFAGDKLQLKVSTNYTGSGDPALATWTSIDGKFPETASDVWTKSDHIDLSAYKGSPVYVAFIYNSTTSSASRWTVDDVQVINSLTPPAVDLTASPSSINFGYQAVATTSTENNFSFSASNLTNDVTLTAPANFSISKTSAGTFSNTLTYTKATVNNTSQTVYVKFSPTTVNTTYNANLTIATNGVANKNVNLSGNTFDIANTLEVVNWNIEWFGSPAQAPTNDALQASNVKTIVNNLNADVYGFAEVVDTTLFKNTVLPAGYGVVFSDFGSYADDKTDADYALSQKLAFMYRSDIIKPLKTFGVLRDTYNPAVASTSVDGTPYKNWSSGRFPYLMEAEVKINNKVDTVYFIEIHAKANTGTATEQIDAYNRRKGGNLQLKNWIDANLAGKKVIILGDFNDVLDADKTIAPMPGTGTSYSDFTNDAANYFPVTLPLSLSGKRSTAGFPTVIDNVIISKNLNVNYLPNSAEVLESVKNLVTNYTSTTTDHYPIKSRYIFGNAAPTIDAIPDQTLCFSASTKTIALTGISAGPETSQTTSLTVTSDNPSIFNSLTIAPNGTDKATVSYQLKNNVNALANITVKVSDNGGVDFGGVDNTSKTFKLTVNSAAIGTITGTTAVSVSQPAPNITFTATNGTAPFTFTYNINGATNRTVTSNTSTATVSAPTTTAGTFVYNLVSIADVNCNQVQTGTATVTVRPLPTATISGSTAVCALSTSPTITFTGLVGVAPFTFTYTLNGGANRTITTSSNTAIITAPTNTAGTFTYTLVSVADANANQAQTGTATVVVNALPVINISSNKTLSISKGEEIILTATGGTQYSWIGNEINSGQNSASVTVRPKQNSTYKVTVRNANGCTSEQTISINVIEDFKLEASTVVTPNGDGFNDKFIIKNIDYYPNNTLKIFDKAGRILYTKAHYSNDWDGTINGSPLSEGTYYYVIDLGQGLGNFKGFINIIRN